MKRFLMLSIYFCSMLSCKDSDSVIDSGTTFPESFQHLWIQDGHEESEDQYGFYFTDTKRYIWNNTGYDPEIGNCFYFNLDVTLIEYQGDLYRVGWKNINAEIEEYVIEMNINAIGSRMNMDGLMSSGTYALNKMDSALNDLEPKCDFGHNEIPDPE